MTTTKFTNLTDESRLIKVDPSNNFYESVKQAQAAQTKFEARLHKDITTNESEVSRLKYEYATKLISGLIKNLDNQIESRRSKYNDYKSRITSWLNQDGTTNQMIMLQTYNALQDWSVSKLMKASKDDKNISKMILTTPLARYGYELSDVQKQMFFDDAVVHVLGEDINDYMQNKAALDVLEITGENLLKKHNQIYSELSIIESTRVNGLPDVG